MKARDPMTAPKSGDRVQFVYIEPPPGSTKKGQPILQADRIEDPDYIREHNLKPDVLYIFEHQLREPLYTIFSILKRITGTSKVTIYPMKPDGKDITNQSKRDIEQRLWANSLIKKQNERNCQRDIITMFRKTNNLSI